MPTVGDVLAERYRLVEPLGAGGSASVWRANDLRLERDVAVKLLAANLANDPVVAARFEREARSLAASSHPNVVAIYDVERGDAAAGREPFYVMELCDGGSLAQRLAASNARRLKPSELAPTIAAIAEGLAWLHDRGLVHRDVKPHNILLCGDRAKLADFGLARSTGPSELAELTATGMTVGTLAYLAPEVMDGEPATAAGDVYGLGVVTFQGLSGSLPRPSGSVAEIVAARNSAVPRVSEVAPRVGQAFDALLAAALSRDPAARPDARTFAGGLTEAVRRGPRAAVIPDADAVTQAIPIRPPPSLQMPEPSGVPPAWATRRRQPGRGRGGPVLAVLLVGALAIAVLVALATFLGDRTRGETSPPPSVTPSASPALSPSPSPSPPSPTPSSPPPSPTPTPDPLAPVRTALSDFLGAVEAARGGQDGLKNREADELAALAHESVDLLDQGDPDGARDQVAQLLDRVDKLSDGLREESADALRATADALATAVEDAAAGD